MTQSAGKIVLVVDDEALLRALVGDIVGRRGHRVIEAPDGLSALDALSAHPEIALVILDVKMPDIDGFETLKQIRERRQDDLPVVMLTVQREEMLRGYATGADYYLTKPFREDRLLNIVDFLIGDLSDAEKAELETQL